MDTIVHKKIVIYGVTVMFLFNFAGLLVSGFTVLRCIFMASAPLVFVQMALEKKVRYAAVELFLYACGCFFLYSDLMISVLPYTTRPWPYFVIFIDVCLVMRLPSRVAITLVTILVLWFIVISVENMTRFGLYDMSGLPSQESRRDRCDCGELPCRMGVLETVKDFAAQVIVVGLDFYFTRSFAQSLHEEYDSMNEVILATERIAISISRFDLTSAKEVAASASLPPPLYDAFSNILCNLHNYRPYLPDALFHELHGAAFPPPFKDIPVPGLKSDKAAIVFTDIQGSTATWEACPEGMKEGLQVHNHTIQDCIAEHNGYEVKTIGDSFMVAFECASDAVWFGLSVQEKLVESVWPEELLELDSCCLQSEGPWCGLRVRIGAHCGEVSVQLNTLTGRYDYFGNTVNKAARMEGACVGGAVAVTPEVMEAAGPLGSVSVIPMGETVLKGINASEAVRPFLLLPNLLLGRSAFVKRQLLLNPRERKIMVTEEVAVMRLSNKDIFLQLCTSATVGSVEVVLGCYEVASDVSAAMNSGLARIVTCSERSHGAMVSLQGNRAAVCWNGPKVCTTHVENSLAFVKTLLRTYASNGKDACFHVGMSTSSVFYGTVGARMQKFVTVLGVGVALSCAICSEAVSDGVMCYFASPFELSETEGLIISRVGTRKTMDGKEMSLAEVSCDDTTQHTVVSTFSL